jgi:cytoskeletal protein RodZ
MDDLKKYIQQHKASLDFDEPGPDLWNAIREQTAVPKKRGILISYTRLAVAACVLVLAGIGTWYLLTDNHQKKAELAAKTANKPAVKENSNPVTSPTNNKEPETETTSESLAQTNQPINQSTNQPINPSTKKPKPNPAALALLQNVETSFTQVINLQRDRVSSMPMYAESPEYFNDFTLQIRQMEKDEKLIKSDIAKRGMTDVLLGQLINVYQQKLGLLKQLQIEMNKTNNRYKQNRGPVDSTKTYFLNL